LGRPVGHNLATNETMPGLPFVGRMDKAQIDDGPLMQQPARRPLATSPQGAAAPSAELISLTSSLRRRRAAAGTLSPPRSAASLDLILL
jgi:hypothetical protein